MDLVDLVGVRVARTASDLLLAPGEAYLGGGSWLYSTPQPDLLGLVDLAGLGWEAVEELDAASSLDGALRIAGTCTIANLLRAASAWPAERASATTLVRQCAEAFLMSFKIWQVATVGGNLCLGLPAGAMISLTSALGGQVELVGPASARTVPVVDFVTDAGATVRQPTEVLRGVRIDAAALRAAYAFRKIALTPIGRSSAVVTARLDTPADGGGCTVTITAATPAPVALRFPALPTNAELAGAIAGIPTWYADAHGPADWRAAVTPILAGEVLEELAAGTGPA